MPPCVTGLPVVITSVADCAVVSFVWIIVGVSQRGSYTSCLVNYQQSGHQTSQLSHLGIRPGTGLPETSQSVIPRGWNNIPSQHRIISVVSSRHPSWFWITSIDVSPRLGYQVLTLVRRLVQSF